MANGARSYTDEELELILRRALERQASTSDHFGHDDLVAAAREVGLDEDAVERAIAEVSHERSFEEIRESIRSRRRGKWRHHFISYAAVVTGLLGLYALGLAGMWVFWVVFGWGIGMAIDTYSKLRAPTDDEVHRERKRLNRKERRKQAAEARRAAKRRRREAWAERTAEVRREAKRAHRQIWAAHKAGHAAHRRRRDTSEQLERVLDEGLNLLLEVAAKKLREASETKTTPETPADSEFGRYVARKRATHEHGVPESPHEPARIRVDPDEEREEHEVELEHRRSSRRRR